MQFANFYYIWFYNCKHRETQLKNIMKKLSFSKGKNGCPQRWTLVVNMVKTPLINANSGLQCFKYYSDDSQRPIA